MGNVINGANRFIVANHLNMQKKFWGRMAASVPEEADFIANEINAILTAEVEFFNQPPNPAKLIDLVQTWIGMARLRQYPFYRTATQELIRREHLTIIGKEFNCLVQLLADLKGVST